MSTENICSNNTIKYVNAEGNRTQNIMTDFAAEPNLEDSYEMKCVVSVDEKEYDRLMGNQIPGIDRIIFNDPATIVYWADSSKTVVKSMKDRQFNPYHGFCAAVAKRMIGNGHNQAVKKLIESKSNIDLEQWEREYNEDIDRYATMFTAIVDSEKYLREKYEPDMPVPSYEEYLK